MALPPKIKVKQGTVIGVESILPNGSPYYFFKGIPYAVPPLGELRFQAPVPLERFSCDEIDCTKEGAVSLQKDEHSGKVIGSEDCLFLNVYTPKGHKDAPLPVMVYIHGGGYTFGSGNSDLYNPLYLLQEGVVVVTLNYRVGILGFLSFPEGNIPGNAGLKDQRLALQWVQQNISQFNGDVNNVTLFGHSAGGACAHLQLLSESSRKFFHKAIIQSGLGNMYWALEDDASEKTKKLAKSIGCTSNDPLEIASFLKRVSDLNEFIKPFLSVPTTNEIFCGRSVPYRPVIENESSQALVTRSAIESMNEENSIDIPVMMGYTSAEGIVLIPAMIGKLEEFNKDLSPLIPKSLNLKLNQQNTRDLVKSIRDFYLKGQKVDETNLDNFNDLVGDYFFMIDYYIAAKIYSRKQHKSPLFFYRFDYDGALNIYKKKIFQMGHLKGVSHADELFYIFQSILAPEPWEEEAKKMVETTCRLWTNFAKYGNPTPKQDDLIDNTWDPVKKIGDSEEFNLNTFVIDATQKMVENPEGERVDFWKNVKNTYGNE